MLCKGIDELGITTRALMYRIRIKIRIRIKMRVSCLKFKVGSSLSDVLPAMLDQEYN